MKARERFARSVARTSPLPARRERGDGGFEHLDRLLRLTRIDEDLAEQRLAGGDAALHRQRRGQGRSPRGRAPPRRRVWRRIRRVGRPEKERGALARIRRDRDGLAEVGDGLVVRAERGGALGGPGRASRAWTATASASAPSGRCLVGRDVVRGQRAGQLVVAERLEVARRGEVAGPPLALGQRAVGDLADERLDEAVLAALGAARVGLDVEQLAPDEAAEARLERVAASRAR